MSPNSISMADGRCAKACSRLWKRWACAPARPGEFSRRAVEHGRLDLTRAEAIADLVEAETPAQLRQAMRQYDGALAALYEGWRTDLIAALARAEAAIDFSDDGVGEEQIIAGRAVAARIIEEIQAHLEDGRRGEALREGLQAGHHRPAQCRQEFADQCPGQAGRGDCFRNSRHHPGCDRAAGSIWAAIWFMSPIRRACAKPAMQSKPKACAGHWLGRRAAIWCCCCWTGLLRIRSKSP